MRRSYQTMHGNLTVSNKQYSHHVTLVVGKGDLHISLAYPVQLINFDYPPQSTFDVRISRCYHDSTALNVQELELHRQRLYHKRKNPFCYSLTWYQYFQKLK